MELDNIFAAHSDKPRRTERRIRLNDEHWRRLDELEQKHGIPVAALIRLAVDCFLPKITNGGFTEQGIVNVWHSRKF